MGWDGVLTLDGNAGRGIHWGMGSDGQAGGWSEVMMGEQAAVAIGDM